MKSKILTTITLSSFIAITSSFADVVKSEADKSHPLERTTHNSADDCANGARKHLLEVGCPTFISQATEACYLSGSAAGYLAILGCIYPDQPSGPSH